MSQGEMSGYPFIHSFIHWDIYIAPIQETYPYIHTCIHTYTRIHTYIHKYMHTHTYLHTYIHVHTYIHTYIHTHIHTYIHTYIWSNLASFHLCNLASELIIQPKLLSFLCFLIFTLLWTNPMLHSLLYSMLRRWIMKSYYNVLRLPLAFLALLLIYLFNFCS